MDERFFNFINELKESNAAKFVSKLEFEGEQEFEELINHLTSLFI